MTPPPKVGNILTTPTAHGVRAEVIAAAKEVAAEDITDHRLTSQPHWWVEVRQITGPDAGQVVDWLLGADEFDVIGGAA